MNRRALLEARADDYAAVALANVRREFPAVVAFVFDGPAELRLPRDLHPAFYGSFDWHSCVEMHWALVCLLRTFPGLAAERDARRVLDDHLTAEKLAAEAAFFAERRHRAVERPYGWGWALLLAHELTAWDDADAQRWTAAFAPLAGVLADRYLEWLPKATYPVRAGTHANSAFGLSLALAFARAQRPELEAAIVDTATRWFASDEDYPAAWEPSGADFLSPALTEAELMRSVLAPVEFAGWLERFLPGLPAGEPAALFTPVTVSDPSDGQIAHLHGLNLSRAWCMRRLAEALPAGDARIDVLTEGAGLHAEAGLPFVVGGDYAVEHWLAAYAVLLLS
ncbi:MAG: DUF2891 domain-containing protein [Thermoleophilia bacterium]|nr:DUF2891 domain-containing protein [Thermoleophilia bacterium]